MNWWRRLKKIRTSPAKLDSRRAKIILVSASHYIGNLFHARDFLPELCAKFEAEAAAFSFERVPDAGKIRWLESLGCPMGLSLANLQPFKRRADALARSLLRRWKSPGDLVGFLYHGVPLGILVHDHYLRHKCVAEADLNDPDMAQELARGINILLTTEEYFRKRQVAWVWSDHPVYLDSGVVLQTAAARGIPCLHLTGTDEPRIHRIHPPVTQFEKFRPRMAFQIPYEEFPHLFQSLAPDRRTQACRWAKRALGRHLCGQNIDLVAGGHSTLRAARRNFTKSGSRIQALVLPRDFSDAPNVYGKMIFPDNLSWLRFVLGESRRTAISWAVKPHPNRWPGSGEKMNHLNEATLEKIRAEFPHVRFLDPHTSYHELIRRGLRSVFTACGSVGHELPALGVAVVNAGRNPHLAYAFNYHPSSSRELAYLIRKADRLRPRGVKRIYEFYYLRYKFLQESFAINRLWPSSLRAAFETAQKLPSREALRSLDREFPFRNLVSKKIRQRLEGLDLRPGISRT